MPTIHPCAECGEATIGVLCEECRHGRRDEDGDDSQ